MSKLRDRLAGLSAERLRGIGRGIEKESLRAQPDGTLEEWVEAAYADVPPRMWPVAARSLLAHVERLRALEPGNNQE